MEIDQQRIDELVQSPSESLNVEVKSWIGSATPEHQAKIVKACLALRNRNGGFLIIGFDDTTLQPDDPTHKPADVRDAFHIDKIQGLISKYSQEIFEVGVGFSTRDGIEYPIIVVPAGVQIPVAAKRDLNGGAGGILIREGTIYFRTLNTSGIPSTSAAHPKDWSDIVEICFENREANIGRFLRRHLGEADRERLVEALRILGFGMMVTPAAPPSTLRQQAEAWLAEGATEFQRALANRHSELANTLSNGISMQVALLVDPAFPARNVDQTFLNTILSSNPNLTGWPIWIDSRASATSENRPYRAATSWNSLIVHERGFADSLDFWIIEPTRFFLWRTLQDDFVPSKVTPGTALDPLLTIIRVAEVIAVGLAFARVLASGSTDPRVLGFAFRWSKLANRRLLTWANPMALLVIGEPRCVVDEVTTYIEVPLDTPTSAIAPKVSEAMRDLFALFDGTEIPLNVFEERTARLLERRL